MRMYIGIEAYEAMLEKFVILISFQHFFLLEYI